MKYKIPLCYTPIDDQALTHVLKKYSGHAHVEIITDFEKEIALLTGAKYVVALNSGTAAIHLALKALGVSQSDEVMAPTFTYVATINPIVYQGATPVLIDSEVDTWNMDPSVLEHAIQSRAKKPKAIIVVHGYGMPAKMDEILYLSKKYEIPLIEDAAEALGSTYKGLHLGTMGNVGVLSFNNNKIVTTFGGGALITNNESIYKQVLHWGQQSREAKPYYEHLQIGYNYRMSPLNAAYGLANLGSLHQLITDRKRLLKDYQKEFINSEVSFLEAAPLTFTNHWLITVLLKKLEKTKYGISAIQQALHNEGIESRPLWKPMHLQPLYKDVPFYGTTACEQLFNCGLCLPSGQELASHDLKVISEVVRSCLN